MKIEQVVFQSGERFPMLVDEQGVPDFWSTLFISQKLRQQTQSSINAFLRSVLLLYKWQKIKQRNLIAEFENKIDKETGEFISGKVLGFEEVESLKEYCGLKVEYIEKELLGKSLSKVVNMSSFSLGSGSPLVKVGNDFQQRRMHDIASYLTFVGREIVKRQAKAQELLNQVESIPKIFKAHYPKSGNKNGNKRLPHAEKDIFLKFMEITQVNHKHNPFKGYDNQFRNYLLIQVMYWTGARAGEVLSLQLDSLDYDIDNPKLTILRTHDDPFDTRKYQPNTKTKSRDIPIPRNLCDDMDYYINKIRSKFPHSRKHPYIFVSHKGPTSGNPMTDSAFYNRVIVTAKAVNPDLFELIKRHGFRHLFNELFSERVDAHNKKINEQILLAEQNRELEEAALFKKQLITEQQEIDSRTILMGWSDSKSARPYIKRHVQKVAKQLHKDMMLDMSKILREEKSKR